MMFKISCTHTRLFSKSRNVVNGSPKSFITQNHNKRCEFKVHHLSRIQPFGIWKRLPYLSHHTSYSTNNEQLKQHERKENNGKDRFSLPLLGAALPVVCAFSLFFKKDRTDAECEGEPLSPEINFPTYKKKGVKNAINHCRDLVQRVKVGHTFVWCHYFPCMVINMAELLTGLVSAKIVHNVSLLLVLFQILSVPFFYS